MRGTASIESRCKTTQRNSRDEAPENGMSEAVRELIKSVVVERTKPGEPIRLKMNGRLAALIGKPLFPESSLSGIKW
jgi:hypothetical protein